MKSITSALSMSQILKYYDFIICCSQDHRRDYILNPFNCRDAWSWEGIISSGQSSVQQIVSAISTVAAKIKSIAVSSVDQAVATLSSLLSISGQIASEIYSTLNSIASKVQMSIFPQLPHLTDGKASVLTFCCRHLWSSLEARPCPHRCNFFAHIGHYLGA